MTYNIDNIVKMNIQDSMKDIEFTYVPERKTWYGRTISEHWRDYLYSLTSEKYNREGIKHYLTNRFLGDDKEVYKKPRVIIWYNDQNNVTHYFETYKEAKEFYSSVESQIPRKYNPK